MQIVVYILFGLLVIGMLIWAGLMGTALRKCLSLSFRSSCPCPPPVPKLETEQ